MNSNTKFLKIGLSLLFIFVSLTLLGQDNNTIHEAVQQQTEQLFDSLVKVRRDLHAHPELSEQEKRTSKKIEDYLKALGLEVHSNIGGYGVVGILKTGKEGKRIAWRADIDALPSHNHEVNSATAESEEANHVCGHDVHTTIALGIANVLTSLKGQLTGTIYFIFQPSEENLKGAKAMMDDGLFDIINPSEIYALHVSPMPQGIIATKPQNLFADYKTLNISYKTNDKKDEIIDYTKNLVSKMQNVASDSKFWDNRNLMDANIGLGNSNTIFQNYITIGSNVGVKQTDDKITIQSAISASSTSIIDSVRANLRASILKSEYAKDLIDVFYSDSIALVLNDEKLAKLSINSISEIYGTDKALSLYGVIPDGRSDDFALFQKEVTGVYFLIGASNFEKGIISMPHSANFAVDENCIKTGVNYFSSLLIERLK
ncbi:M20 metallopeptidase family protein [Bernardetia sp.]|uniref:M20 metallopeptidase family protein n=1 Tax=Bernardetia sp. TaxID=1937974 RepID=UPI0025C5BABB|nr:M20 family metallopeptidase [Bernardetia sp.]